MPSKNLENLRAAHESWNRRDFDATVRLMTQNVTYTDNSRGITLKSPAEFKNWAEEWVRSCSDAKITRPRYIDAGDTIVTQFTATGTNDGPLGPFPASGRRMNLEYCEITRFNANGQIISGEIYYDLYTLLTQLGHIKPPASAAKA